MLGPQADAKGIKIRNSFDEQLPSWCNMDPTRIRQIILNFLCNAIKFSNGKDVFIQAEQTTNGHLQITVEDQGIGIPKAGLDHIFNPFAQLDLSTTRNFGGTGLGLTICKKLVELMGGTIGVNSEEGVGSRFYFIIPLTKASSASPPPKKEFAESPNFSDLKILVAEDNEINRQVVDLHLKKVGVNADFVTDGREAINLSAEKQYDVIFMDCQMPIMDGLEASKIILSRDSSHKPTIVALTASVLLEERQRCQQVGMSDFITKPLKRSDLIRVLSKISSIRSTHENIPMVSND